MAAIVVRTGRRRKPFPPSRDDEFSLFNKVLTEKIFPQITAKSTVITYSGFSSSRCEWLSSVILSGRGFARGFLWIMDKRMEMGRTGAAVTIRMRRVAGETPTLTRLQRVPLPL